MKLHTVITGASSGLGKAFAHEFAQRGHHLILVSLPGEGLSLVAHQLQYLYPPLKVHHYEADLSQRHAIEAFAGWLKEHDMGVNFLVNNAGIGGSMAFQEADADRIDSIIQLNVRGTALLTRALLPLMLHNTRAFILNVSSIAAFSPLPYKMVYPATKAFIYSFSRGLNAEFYQRGLQVSVVHPGAMPTNDDIKARIQKHGWLGRLSSTSPEYVACYAINAAYSGETVIVPGTLNWLNYLMFRYLPWRFLEPVITRTLRKELTLAV